MASIKMTDPELQGSFSFTSSTTGYDFINSSSIFLDDDYHISDDEESYIEIAFDQPAAKINYSNSADLELRISLSSSLPLPDQYVSSNTTNHFDLVTLRKSAGGNDHGMMMKFLKKLRSMNLGALLASLMKQTRRQVFFSSRKNKYQTDLAYLGGMKKLEKGIIISSSSKSTSPIHQAGCSSKVYDARENSIQAAIAHCKTSSSSSLH